MSAGLAVLISGRGSNLQAILRSPVGAQVTAVVSDNPQAAGLEYARAHNKPAFVVTPEDFDSAKDFSQKMIELLQAIDPQLIVLAGYMRILSAAVVCAFAGRIVNIHPSLLPAFPGRDTHARALAAGAVAHGCTVHWVTADVDGGEIIACRRVPVRAADDEPTLAARVLAEEHVLYPQVLAKLLA